MLIRFHVNACMMMLAELCPLHHGSLHYLLLARSAE